MTELFFFLMFIAAVYGIGSFLLKFFKLESKSFWEEFAFANALGLLLAVYVTLLLGVLGILDRALFISMAAASVVIFRNRIISFAAAVAKASKSQFTGRFNFSKLLLLILVAFAILNLVASTAPVASSDALAYHVALPKLYVSGGSISFYPSIIPSAYPSAADMLFLYGFILDGGVLSGLVSFYIVLLLAISIYAFGRRFFSMQAALLASVVFYTLPLVSVYNTRAFVDISTALFAFLSFYALFLWHSHRKSSLLVLSALMAGLSASTKISGILAVAVIALAVIYSSLLLKNISLRNKIIAAVKSSFVFSVVSAFVVVPWYVRSFLYTGNPVYPLLFSVFGGINLHPGIVFFWFRESLQDVGLGTSVFSFLLLPWNMTMHPSAFGDLLGIGPVFLAVIPLLLLLGKADRKIIAILAMALLFLAGWFITGQNLRYVIVIFALFAVVSACVLSQLLRHNALKYVAAAVIAATLLFNSAALLGTNYDKIPVALNLVSRDSYLSGHSPTYGLFQFANENLPAGSRLCLYGESRGYYSDNNYIWCNPSLQSYVDFYRMNSSQQLAHRLKELNITHVVYDRTAESDVAYYAGRNLPHAAGVFMNGNRIMHEFLSERATLLFSNDNGAVYRLTY